MICVHFAAKCIVGWDGLVLDSWVGLRGCCLGCGSEGFSKSGLSLSGD